MGFLKLVLTTSYLPIFLEKDGIDRSFKVWPFNYNKNGLFYPTKESLKEVIVNRNFIFHSSECLHKIYDFSNFYSKEIPIGELYFEITKGIGFKYDSGSGITGYFIRK